MSENLRILNPEGCGQWRRWIDSLRGDPSLPVPRDVLSNPDTSVAPPLEIRIPPGPFGTKLELARQLLPVVIALENARLPDAAWPGVWDALALSYFDEICPLRDGKRKVKASERYCFSSDYRKSHRHRIRGPIILYQIEQNAAPLFLSSSVESLSDQEEQVGSRQEILSSGGLLHAMSLLYWKASENKPLRGWATNSPKPGSLRRFIALVGQLGRTFDLQATSASAVIRLLPKEFDAWRVRTES